MTNINYQEKILNALTQSKSNVSVYLVNGIRLQGSIESQDQYTVLLKNNDISQLIYKHAITTILPSSAVSFNKEKRREAEASPE